MKTRALLNHLKFAEELKKLGKTQEEFAEDMGISDRYVRELKRINKNITISLAYNLSVKFQIPIEDLLIVVDDDKEE